MDDVLAIIINDLAFTALGFVCGWLARRATARAAQYAIAQAHSAEEGPMHERRYALVAAVTTLVIALLAALVVAIAEMYGNTGQLQDLWNACRHLNYPLGVVVAVGVTYRIVLMAFDRPHWREPRALHLMLWFIYIAANLVAAAMTSHHYELAGADATWVSGLRTLLMLGAVVLTVWWPHPHRFTPIEESR